MTKKRFVYYEHKGADYILDTPNKSLDFIEMLGDCLEAEEIVDLLNCLNDENGQLKRSVQYWYAEHKRIVNNYVDKIKEVEKENEKLKKENYELHKRLGDFEPFEDHIKERTSKTSVNDIIGLVKTDEPTDIVELEKELQE